MYKSLRFISNIVTDDYSSTSWFYILKTYTQTKAIKQHNYNLNLEL